jgi:AraC family transcriptional activator of pobA
MTPAPHIPDFALFGETESFPDLVHCEAFSARAPIHNWRISAHRHGHMAQLFIVDDGRIDAVIDGESATVQPQDFLYIPAQMVHQFTFKPNSTGLVISFPSATFDHVAGADELLRTRLAQWQAARLPKPARDVAQILVASSAMAGPFRAKRIFGLGQALLVFIAESAGYGDPTHTKQHPILARLDALISEQAAISMSPAHAADTLAVSTGHLSRLCRAATGRGAGAYIERKRMQEACRMLAFTQTPVSEIGFQLGYSDPSYFSKRFRHVVQTSPSEYRARFVNA